MWTQGVLAQNLDLSSKLKRISKYPPRKWNGFFLNTTYSRFWKICCAWSRKIVEKSPINHIAREALIIFTLLVLFWFNGKLFFACNISSKLFLVPNLLKFCVHFFTASKLVSKRWKLKNKINMRIFLSHYQRLNAIVGTTISARSTCTVYFSKVFECK